MPPQFFASYNNEGRLAKTIFHESHKEMVKSGSQWLTSTSESCSLVAALITTVAFASATTIPGGNGEEGTPPLEKELGFLIFALSSLVALCLSTTSVITFLAILTSRLNYIWFRIFVWFKNHFIINRMICCMEIKVFNNLVFCYSLNFFSGSTIRTLDPTSHGSCSLASPHFSSPSSPCWLPFARATSFFSTIAFATPRLSSTPLFLSRSQSSSPLRSFLYTTICWMPLLERYLEGALKSSLIIIKPRPSLIKMHTVNAYAVNAISKTPHPRNLANARRNNAWKKLVTHGHLVFTY